MVKMDTLTDQYQKLQVKDDNSDKISSLHESVLYHILSFLPTKYVVQTSLLSKRWQELWVSLPYLNFGESANNNKEWFMNFVDKVLFNRDNSATIIRFRLSCHHACDDSHVNEWISGAASARVETLDIYLPSRNNNIHSLPSLCSCSCLMTLKLDFGTLVQFPKFFCFPKLKIMYLYRVIVAENFNHQLLNCPNLKNLRLRSSVVDISNPSSLTNDSHSIGTLSNLDTASFCLEIRNSSSPEESGIYVVNFIRKFANLKALHLSHLFIQIFQCKGNLLNHLPTFYNLTHLEIWVHFEDAGHVGVMACLLRRSPVLQSLIIRAFHVAPVVLEYQQQNFPSLRLPASLKWIKLLGFRQQNEQDVHDVLRFIFGNVLGNRQAMRFLVRYELKKDLISLSKMQLQDHRQLRNIKFP